MNLELTILGSSSAIPLVNRFPSAQYLQLAGRTFLIDCGEGTQMRLRENKLGFGRLGHIFISHLHGDHFFGLAPLLSTLNLLDRKKEIHVYAHKGLEEALNLQWKIQHSKLKYPLIFHTLNPEEKECIYEDTRVKVYSFPLKHGIPCCGFLFEEKPRDRHIKRDALKKYNIPIPEIKKIKAGEDWINEMGHRIANEELTSAAESGLSYAYCTDTLPLEKLSDFLSCPTLLYHEATFGEEHSNRAMETKHSTALQAGRVAAETKAKYLIIGHFSIRYSNMEFLKQEAATYFPEVHLAEEGKTYHIPHKGDRLTIKDKQ